MSATELDRGELFKLMLRGVVAANVRLIDAAIQLGQSMPGDACEVNPSIRRPAKCPTTLLSSMLCSYRCNANKVLASCGTPGDRSLLRPSK
jgi:hypothetical protein